jgi:hypothetical protein
MKTHRGHDAQDDDDDEPVMNNSTPVLPTQEDSDKPISKSTDLLSVRLVTYANDVSTFTIFLNIISPVSLKRL